MNHYDTYKPSGIDWIGDVPSHWEVKQIRFLGEVISGSTPKTSEPTFWDGDINWITPADMKAKTIASGARSITKEGLEEVSSSLLPIGSIILSSRAPIGLVALAEEPLVTNQGCKTLVPNKDLNSLFGYYMVLANVDSLKSKGNATTFDELGMGTYKHHKVCIPPLSEQEAIAAYLDKRCGEIDKVITTQERRIELLREMKQSIITRAVTKGINPNAPMKDSGVEWIGEVPAHWEVTPLKYLITFINGYAFNSNSFIAEGEIPVYRIGDISDNCVSHENNVYVSKNEALERFLTNEGDLLLAMSGATTGKVGVIKENQQGYINQRVGIIRSNFQQWIFYSLCTNLFAEYVALAAIGSAQPNISTESFGNYTIALPPDNERQQVEMYIKRKTKALDAAITKAQREVELLRELKQATITEVVTGKRKVC